MAEYYEIQIDDIYLSKDGLEHAAGIGSRCALNVEGVPGLQSNYRKNKFLDFRGNPILLKTNVGTAGREIVITVTGKLPAAVALQIIALHQASELNDTVIRLQGNDADTPDFDHYVLPDVEPFTWTGFDGFGNYLGAVLRYVTVGDTELFWDTDQLLYDGDELLWS